jgi:hypothetical protein
MRDWLAYVTEHLCSPLHARAVDEEVLHELAGHLEERYQALLSQGLAEEEAFRKTCSEVGGWIELHEGILSAKEGTMQNRVRQLWIPGLVTFVGAAAFLAILEYAGVRPVVFRSSGESPMSHPYDSSGIILNVPWLISLLAVGALGAFLSRRARATRLVPHISSAFPALIMGIVIVLVFAGGRFLDWSVPQQIKTLGLPAAGLNMVVMPGVALLLGDVLLQWLLKRRGVSS